MKKISITLHDFPTIQWAHECHPLSYVHPRSGPQRDLLGMTYFTEGEWDFVLDGVTHHMTPGSCYLTYPGLDIQSAALCGAARHAYLYVEIRPFPKYDARSGLAPEYSLSLPCGIPHISDNALSGLLKQVIYFHSAGESIDALGFFYKALSLYAKLGELQQEKNYNQLYSEKIIHFLEGHYNLPLRLSDVARSVGLSEPYCCEVFRSVTGMSIMQYLNQLRVNIAKDYIQSGNASLKEIAVLVGVKNYAYFCRIFKQYEYMSPSQFQQLHHSGFIFAAHKEPAKIIYRNGNVRHVDISQKKIRI